tara:strand:+ start:112 stop:927 length:816 start_codon:yes stop_codon:yes gene_type:complete
MLALAFGLVIIAGACTGIGASLVFCKCVTKENKLLLASALGFAAGVMLYVTFVEIFQKSLDGFAESGLRGDSSSGPVYAVTTATFFCGMLLMWGLEKLVDCLHKKDDRLSHMGFMTALAICIHNFPEGVATFVATLRDPSFGIVMAFAIGMHNIPEGMCVSIPLYYANGQRCKGFMWALVSGISEPIGALLAYLVLSEHMGPTSFGIIFGLVAGMMTYICLHELIPTAHRYDPDDRRTTLSIMLGMAVMAISLVGFSIEVQAEALNTTHVD